MTECLHCGGKGYQGDVMGDRECSHCVNGKVPLLCSDENNRLRGLLDEASTYVIVAYRCQARDDLLRRIDDALGGEVRADEKCPGCSTDGSNALGLKGHLADCIYNPMRVEN